MKPIKKILLSSFACLLFGICLPHTPAYAADTPVNETTFPDNDFRQYVLAQIDQNKDRVLTDEEKNNIRKIVVDANSEDRYEVKNFQGIEVFTELEELQILQFVEAEGEDECGYSFDLTLDLSANKKLKIFVCKAGQVTNLNLSGLVCLEELQLDCEYPLQDLSRLGALKRVDIRGSSAVKEIVVLPKEMLHITSLKLGSNIHIPERMPALQTLSLDTPNVPADEFSIDFHKYPTLTTLSLMGVNMTELDVSEMKNLKSFHCGGYRVNTINMRGCSALEELDVSSSALQSNMLLGGCTNIRRLKYGFTRVTISDIQIGELADLEYLDCNSTGAKVLDLSNNHKLREVQASLNELTEVRLSSQASYETLSLIENKLTKLDLRNIKVRTVLADLNSLKEIAFSPDQMYKEISLNGNKLTKLDLRKTNVQTIRAERNKLKEIRLSTKTPYKMISLDNNRLTKLDLRNVKAETVLCRRNDLKKLLLSARGKYKTILVDQNFLTKLDLRNINVQTVTCRDNRIRSLKVRKNKTIRKLDCRHNKLKSLDVRQCRKLKKLLWYSGSKGLKKSKIRRR